MFFHSIYEDSQGDLWLSAFSEGVLRYDTKKNQFNLLKSPPTEQPVVEEKPNVFYVNEDNNGNLIVVPRNGSICYYDRDSEQLNYFSTELHGEKLTHILSSRQYCKDNSGNFWIGSQKGLSRITFIKIFTASMTLVYDEWGIRALMQDGAGNLWAASRKRLHKNLRWFNKLLGYLSDNGRLNKQKDPLWRQHLHNARRQARAHLAGIEKVRPVFVGKKQQGILRYSKFQKRKRKSLQFKL
jgi:ligand-binding sensor domain-containing protein